MDGLDWTGHVFRHSPYTPAFDVAGLALGVQFAAGWGGDGLLLRLAAQLEAAAPWHTRVPAVWAGR